MTRTNDGAMSSCTKLCGGLFDFASRGGKSRTYQNNVQLEMSQNESSYEMSDAADEFVFNKRIGPPPAARTAMAVTLSSVRRESATEMSFSATICASS